jgi:AraC-like DNA-binding protein
MLHSRVKDRLEPGAVLDYHMHHESYLTVVLAGGYSEYGGIGRAVVAEGDVIYHAAFQAHSNRAGPRGAYLRNIPVDLGLDGWCGHLCEASAINRLLATSARELREIASDLVTRRNPVVSQWQDELASDLASGRVHALGQWAREHGLRPDALATGFRERYGCTPSRFRSDLRSRAAWREILQTSRSLAEIAFHTGFADQAHMTRAVGELTRKSPGLWRRSLASWLQR